MGERRAAMRCPRGLAEVVRALARLVALPAGQGWVEDGGRIHRFPVPPRSTRLAGAGGRAGYLTTGARDLEAFLSARADRYGWRYVERLGAAHILASERHRLIVVARRCSRFLTLMECVLVERRRSG
jgi:hypothetical protein